MRQAEKLRKELLTGLVIWLVPVLLLSLVIANHRLAMLAGVLAGGATAAGLLFHMYHHLYIALDLDAKHAQSHTQFAAIQRLAIMAVVLAASMVYPAILHPIGVVLGIFGLKITALMNPFLHKQLVKRREKKSSRS